jgi:hypothetical protein
VGMVGWWLLLRRNQGIQGVGDLYWISHRRLEHGIEPSKLSKKVKG